MLSSPSGLRSEPLLQESPLTPPKDNINRDDGRQLKHYRSVNLHKSYQQAAFPLRQPASGTYFGLHEGRGPIHHATDAAILQPGRPAVLSFIWMLFDLEVPSPSIVFKVNFLTAPAWHWFPQQDAPLLSTARSLKCLERRPDGASPVR